MIVEITPSIGEMLVLAPEPAEEWSKVHRLGIGEPKGLHQSQIFSLDAILIGTLSRPKRESSFHTQAEYKLDLPCPAVISEVDPAVGAAEPESIRESRDDANVR